ncbi:MAG TPA: GNAT family N-acetyltransferase [Solirubrobacteraceae bacterium]|nr:GNAT family N-acetyltransferase [Solirubrobacteraceae bacterium]
MPLLPITTERLELRELTLDDAPVIFAIYGDPEVMRWVAGGPVADLAAAEAVLQQVIAHQRTHGYSWWGVVERATGRLVGDAGLYSYEGTGPGVELGYTFARDAWGRGYATEAAVACLRAAFGPLGLERVVAVVRPENAASQHVLEKAGMRRAGSVEYRGHEHVRFRADCRSWRAPAGARAA